MSEAQKLLIARAGRQCVQALELARWAARMGDFELAQRAAHRAAVASKVAFFVAVQK